MNIDEIKRNFIQKLRPFSFFFPYSSLLYLGENARNQIDILYFKIFEIVKIKNLIECGAKEATASLMAIKKGANALAIEANPITFEKLTPKNNSNFTKLNIGLSDKSGVLDFFFPKKNNISGASTFLPKNLSDYKKIKIRTIQLDDLIEKYNLGSKPFCLWIDVEGMQKKLLLGAKKTLKNHNCKFLKIEVEERELFSGQSWFEKDIENYLYKYNFIPIFIDFERTYQHNIIFVKKSIYDKIYSTIEETNNISVSKKKSYFKIIKFITKCDLKIDLKINLIKLFGKNLGHYIAKLFGSKISKNYINNH